ncbi:Crp/Fnr family transcriptional regulator [Shewanella sp. AS1]|uniref:Crp/Fnr family transcriptional regulator n=1 Tax=Shewanella sp. AS1 TaxID=2907626 RepID=UPI001F3A3038|nr:Crp/Fnr family transcriptional regulator [Shewanella sp. AS1]MCE9678126.1 Crp/Fnr family transcriptional regulator [Shewanella sp. AS1]
MNQSRPFHQFLTELGLSDQAILDTQALAKAIFGSEGEILLHQGDRQNYAYFIESGVLKACHYNDKGGSLVKEYYFEQELCFLYQSWLTESPSRYQLEVVQKAKLIRVPLSLLETPSWEQAKWALIRQQLIYKEEKEAFFLLNSPEQRYRYLLQHRPLWVAMLTSQQLASYIGINPVSLSRLKARIHRQSE